MNTSGIVMSTVVSLSGDIKLISSKNALNKRKQANEALPTEYPLVLALVTFPTASNLSVISLTSAGYSDISTIPPALSAIGPNPLIDKINIPVQNIPIVAIAVPNNPPIHSPLIFVMPLNSPK
mmetsp:Transcript_12111/g.1089  ORF Transcript_12111/g.1089 Transcript_12111/m.1089 type:complete len:123 (-) Transcript_12111:1524-1892(-)